MIRNATLAVLLLAVVARAEDRFYGDLDPVKLRGVATLDDGRRKPLDSLAREKVEHVSGDSSILGQDPVVTFLSMVYEPEKWIDTPVIYVKDAGVRSLLNIQRDAGDGTKMLTKWISQKEWLAAIGSGKLQEKDAELDKDGTKVGRGRREKFTQAVGDLSARAQALADMPKAFAPVPIGSKELPWGTIEQATKEVPTWGPRLAEIDASLRTAFRTHDAAGANKAMAALAEALPKVNPQMYPQESHLKLETFVNRFQPMRWAWGVFFGTSLLAMIQLGTGRHLWLPMSAAAVGLALNVFAVVARGVLAERWPLGNLYEVMSMGGAVVTLIGFILTGVYRSSYFLAAGSFLSALVLVGAGMLNLEFRILSPLVPVLKSYWMQYHVTCMVGAYSGATLAFGVSVVYLIGYALGRRAPEHLDLLETYIYRTVQVAFVFFTAGIMLGALWANESWGRYWGWDPKEIWALICWLVYAVYLHGRMIGWCRRLWAAWACVIGFIAVVFTFWGVNFLLKGLHSYAN